MNRTSKTTFALAFAVSFLGCGSQFAEVCEISNDCIGGNEADLDACIASAEAEQDKASAYGCDAEFDAYFLCYEESLDCNDEQLEIDDDCIKDELDDLSDCIDDGSDLDD